MSGTIAVFLANARPGSGEDYESLLRSQPFTGPKSTSQEIPERSYRLLPIPYPAPSPHHWSYLTLYSHSAKSQGAVGEGIVGVPGLKSLDKLIDRDTALLLSASPLGPRRSPPNAASVDRAELFVVMTNAKAGEDDAFNDWYDNRHLVDVMAAPGFVGVRRFRLECETAGYRSPWSYLALYEIARGAAEVTLAAVLKMRGTDAMPLSPSFDRNDFFAKPYTLLV